MKRDQTYPASSTVKRRESVHLFKAASAFKGQYFLISKCSFERKIDLYWTVTYLQMLFPLFP